MSTYYSDMLANRLSRRSGIARKIQRDNDVYERVVSLSIQTDPHSGAILWRIAIDEIGPGLGPHPDILGTYPVSCWVDSNHDAIAVASRYGLRLRKASAAGEWDWISWDPEQAERPDGGPVPGA